MSECAGKSETMLPAKSPIIRSISVESKITFIFSAYTFSKTSLNIAASIAGLADKGKISRQISEYAFSALKIDKLSEPAAIIYLKTRPIYSIMVLGAY